LNFDDFCGVKKLASMLNSFRNGPVLLIACPCGLVCTDGIPQYCFLWMNWTSPALIQVNGGGLARSLWAAAEVTGAQINF
jgi:hypothetical protein